MTDDNPGPASRTATPITPQPKQILSLRHTLAARPDPRPAAVPPAQPEQTTTGRTDNPDSDESRPPVSGTAGEPVSGAAVAQAAETTPRSELTTSRPSALDKRLRPTRRRDHTVFYLPVGVSNGLRDLARRQNKTNADVIFDAIEAALPELPSLLAPADSAGEHADQVFQRSAAKPVGQKVQISAVISTRNLAVIDRLVTDHGADSRSQLVEAALNAYLTDLGAVTV